MNAYTVYAPSGIGEIPQGASIADIIMDSFVSHPLKDGDILIVAHKIVSKAEGRTVLLDDIQPGEDAKKYAEILNKDPRLIQVILNESRQIVSFRRNGPIICRDIRGLVCANAAVDCSNSPEDTRVIMLPIDPDISAQMIRADIEATLGIRIGVIICDTHGRAFRNGACGIAVGASGVICQKSYIGVPDRRGRIMQSSVEGVVDELSAAATLVMGQGNEGRPIVLIRGCDSLLGDGKASDMIRPLEQDLFLGILNNDEDNTNA